MDIEKTEKEDINAVLNKLEEYVEPRVNTIYERCVFYRRNQKEYETFEKYVNEIKTMSKKCKFENITTDQIIRDKIIN